MSKPDLSENLRRSGEEIRKCARLLARGLEGEKESALAGRVLYLLEKLETGELSVHGTENPAGEETEALPGDAGEDAAAEKAEGQAGEDAARTGLYAGICVDLIRIAGEALEEMRPAPGPFGEAAFASSVACVFAASRGLAAWTYTLTGFLADRGAAKRLNSSALREEERIGKRYEKLCRGAMERILYG